MRRKDKSLGLATVYRVFKVLVESGIAREVRLGDGVVRYEHNIEHEHHDHLTCEVCGKTVEIVDEKIEEIQQRLAEEHKFTLTGHLMNIYGIARTAERRKAFCYSNNDNDKQ